MPYITLTHHLLAYHQQENETVTYNVDEFAESLVMALDTARKRSGMGTEAEPAAEAEPAEADTANPLASILDETPITISSYVGLPSFVFNQSKLGYYLDRGGYNF